MRLPDRKLKDMETQKVDLVIRAKRTVFPDGIRPCAVCVSDGVIDGIDEFDAPVNAVKEIIVPDDQVLMPGLVDSHVHAS